MAIEHIKYRHFMGVAFGEGEDHGVSQVKLADGCYSVEQCQPYPFPLCRALDKIADRLADRTVADLFSASAAGGIVVDVTCLGRPFIDRVREKIPEPARVCMVRFNAGFDEFRDSSDIWSIPELDVVTALTILLETGAFSSGLDRLNRDLKHLQCGVADLKGEDHVAWRAAGTPADVFSLAIALWAAWHPEIRIQKQEVPLAKDLHGPLPML
jgi:hypothetical protein